MLMDAGGLFEGTKWDCGFVSAVSVIFPGRGAWLGIRFCWIQFRFVPGYRCLGGRGRWRVEVGGGDGHSSPAGGYFRAKDVAQAPLRWRWRIKRNGAMETNCALIRRRSSFDPVVQVFEHQP